MLVTVPEITETAFDDTSLEHVIALNAISFQNPICRADLLKIVERKKALLAFAFLKQFNWPIGYLMGWSIENALYIGYTAVSPIARRQLVGTRLVDWFVDIARTKHIEFIDAHYCQAELQTRRFWLSQGFSERYCLLNAYGPNSHAMHIRRNTGL